MSEQEEFSLPDIVVTAAIEYVRDKYEIHLYAELLIEIYGEIYTLRGVMATRGRSDPSLKSANYFEAAMASIVDDRYPQTDEPSQKLNKAICSAMHKIGAGIKAARSKPKKRRTHTPLERLKSQVIVDPTNPQLSYRV